MDKKEPSSSDPQKRLLLPAVTISRKSLTKRLRKAEGATVRHARKFILQRLDRAREVRRLIAVWVVMVAYVIAATVLQSAWYQQGYMTTAGAQGGTYAEAVLGPLDNLNPLFADSSAEQAASELIFSGLMKYDSTGNLNYDLASNMKLDDSERVYTLTIRDNAKWHDGQPVTAKDVAYTVKLINDPQVHATITSFGSVAVKAVDEKTVQFTLPTVYAAFAHYLTFPILPSHILESISPSAIQENSFSKQPIGSGPFAFRLLQDTDINKGRKIVHLVRNSEYFGGSPKLERLQLDVYEDNAAIVSALNQSAVNASADLSVIDAGKVNKNRYSIQRKPVNAGVYAILNTTSDLLKDVNVRRALQAGTDTKTIRNVLGDGTPALHLPFVNGQLSGEVPPEPKFSQEQARKLLDKAGWAMESGVRKKDGQTLRLNVAVINKPDFEKVAEKLVAQWQEIGVVVSMRVVDPTNIADRVAQDVLRPRNYDVLIYQLATSADPDVYAYWHSSQANQTGANYSNYNNILSDDALVSARDRIDSGLRNAKYLTFARQWLSDVPAIGLYQTTVQYISNINNRTLAPDHKLVSASDRYSSIVYWTVNERNVFTTP